MDSFWKQGTGRKQTAWYACYNHRSTKAIYMSIRCCLFVMPYRMPLTDFVYGHCSWRLVRLSTGYSPVIFFFFFSQKRIDWPPFRPHSILRALGIKNSKYATAACEMSHSGKYVAVLCNLRNQIATRRFGNFADIFTPWKSNASLQSPTFCYGYLKYFRALVVKPMICTCYLL